ncbi:MAG: 1-deoxy-D-xylulose-5-phosphate synthase [Oscillospiraceae bacterium]|nr:1-deoxy-D-xylulose-5-phosphate synthase [Oscillospiraceae bacterium]
MNVNLDKLSNIEDIHDLTMEELENLSVVIRSFLIGTVAKTGGHLASNLGVVELTLSLYKVFDFDIDKIVWDVGHQAYVHKILTGRKEFFSTLRQYDGLSGFPKRHESVYDHFGTGHATTSLSASLGMAKVRDLRNENYEVISVIGDGALTGGMAYEALNDIGYSQTKLIIILNDNEMSISKNVGILSSALSKLRIRHGYNFFRDNFNKGVKSIPLVGDGLVDLIENLKKGVKQLVVPSMVFENLGLKYIGPIDGHNIKELTRVFSLVKDMKWPILIHIKTKKGKGYEFAEKDPSAYHGVSPFNYVNGEFITNGKNESYSSTFGDELLEIAKSNYKIVAITAAMTEGVGLSKFKEAFPKRCFDVGIAEEHAVTMAAGIASTGFKPVVAIYSTFLQRAFDQIIHDVCLQNLPVVFAIDRGGIVGEDGETHQGIYDLSYLSVIPNMTILAPKCMGELRIMLRWALDQNYPIAIRYPRGGDHKNVSLSPIKNLIKGKWEILFESRESSVKIAIIAVGKMVANAILAREKLLDRDICPMLISGCFVKPIDEDMLTFLIDKEYNIVTVEDNLIQGGFGSSVLEFVSKKKYDKKILTLGFNDVFVPQGKVDILYEKYGLSSEEIAERIEDFFI